MISYVPIVARGECVCSTRGCSRRRMSREVTSSDPGIGVCACGGWAWYRVSSRLKLDAVSSVGDCARRHSSTVQQRKHYICEINV